MADRSGKLGIYNYDFLDSSTINLQDIFLMLIKLHKVGI